MQTIMKISRQKGLYQFREQRHSGLFCPVADSEKDCRPHRHYWLDAFHNQVQIL